MSSFLNKLINNNIQRNNLLNERQLLKFDDIEFLMLFTIIYLLLSNTDILYFSNNFNNIMCYILFCGLISYLSNKNNNNIIFNQLNTANYYFCQLKLRYLQIIFNSLCHYIDIIWALYFNVLFCNIVCNLLCISNFYGIIVAKILLNIDMAINLSLIILNYCKQINNNLHNCNDEEKNDDDEDDESVDELVNESVDELDGESEGESVDELVNESVDELDGELLLNKSVDELDGELLLNKLVDESDDESVNELLNKSLNVCSESAAFTSENSDSDIGYDIAVPYPTPESVINFWNNFMASNAIFTVLFPTFGQSQMITKSAIIKILFAYIKENKLYFVNEDGSYNKQIVVPDEPLKKLFLMDDNKAVLNPITIEIMDFIIYVNRLFNQ